MVLGTLILVRCVCVCVCVCINIYIHKHTYIHHTDELVERMWKIGAEGKDPFDDDDFDPYEIAVYRYRYTCI